MESWELIIKLVLVVYENELISPIMRSYLIKPTSIHIAPTTVPPLNLKLSHFHLQNSDEAPFVLRKNISYINNFLKYFIFYYRDINEIYLKIIVWCLVHVKNIC